MFLQKCRTLSSFWFIIVKKHILPFVRKMIFFGKWKKIKYARLHFDELPNFRVRICNPNIGSTLCILCTLLNGKTIVQMISLHFRWKSNNFIKKLKIFLFLLAHKFSFVFTVFQLQFCYISRIVYVCSVFCVCVWWVGCFCVKFPMPEEIFTRSTGYWNLLLAAWCTCAHYFIKFEFLSKKKENFENWIFQPK